MARPRRSPRSLPFTDPTPLVRLWLLRLLVQLNTHRNFIVHGSFNDDTLAEALGFGECINSNDTELNPGLIGPLATGWCRKPPSSASPPPSNSRWPS